MRRQGHTKYGPITTAPSDRGRCHFWRGVRQGEGVFAGSLAPGAGGAFSSAR